MQYEFTIKLNQEELDKFLEACDRMPFGEVFKLLKKIATQVDAQRRDAAEFEFDMEHAAMNWKPTPPSTMTMEEALQKLKEQMSQDTPVGKPKKPKKHWTQTPAGKAKMAARKKRGAK